MHGMAGPFTSETVPFGTHRTEHESTLASFSSGHLQKCRSNPGRPANERFADLRAEVEALKNEKPAPARRLVRAFLG